MNVPEALRATQNATDAFSKAVAVATDELAAEMRRIHVALLEEQPSEEAAPMRIRA